MNKAHILLDFFGTVVEYVRDPNEVAYPTAFAEACSLGWRGSYAGFVSDMNAAFDQLREQGDRSDLAEFTQEEAATRFLASFLDRPAPSDLTARFAQIMQVEWNTCVGYPAESVEVIHRLAANHHISIVSNTHDRDLVPAHLDRMGLRSSVQEIITSVEVGHRKPHPAIYEAALSRLGIRPADALFVGDTFDADYAGPRRMGIQSLLIDPANQANIPERDRLGSLAELPGWLRINDRFDGPHERPNSPAG